LAEAISFSGELVELSLQAAMSAAAAKAATAGRRNRSAMLWLDLIRKLQKLRDPAAG